MKAIIRKEMLDDRQKTLDVRLKTLDLGLKTIRNTFTLPIVNCLMPILFFILVNTTSHAQVLSLDSVLAIIEKQNPLLDNFRYRAEAMNTYALGANAWMAPEVGGGLWMIPYKKVEDPRDKGQIMLSVQQQITNPAKLKASQRYMESKASIENANERIAYNELRSQAKSAYYQLLVLAEKKNILKENEEIITLMLKLAQLRYPYNQGKLGSIYEVEGKLYEVRNMLVMNESGRHHKISELSQLMNMPHEFHFSPDTVYSVPTFIPEKIDTSTFVLNRSDIQKIDKSIQSMKLNQLAEQAQAKPDFNISFNHMIPRGAGMPSQFMLLGMVSIPIAPWSSKMYKSNTKGMALEIEAMKRERAFMLNEMQGMTTRLTTEIKTLEMQIKNYKKQILPALKKNYETTMLAYEENKEALPAVIDAWEAWNMTQMQHLDTVQKYYEMIVEYEKQIEK